MTTITLPAGWRVERRDCHYIVAFDVYETGGTTWPCGDPRPALTVELRPNWGEERYGAPVGPEISWHSTSDGRPALAQALAVALAMAVAEAEFDGELKVGARVRLGL